MGKNYTTLTATRPRLIDRSGRHRRRGRRKRGSSSRRGEEQREPLRRTNRIREDGHSPSLRRLLGVMRRFRLVEVIDAFMVLFFLVIVVALLLFRDVLSFHYLDAF